MSVREFRIVGWQIIVDRLFLFLFLFFFGIYKERYVNKTLYMYTLKCALECLCAYDITFPVTKWCMANESRLSWYYEHGTIDINRSQMQLEIHLPPPISGLIAQDKQQDSSGPFRVAGRQRPSSCPGCSASD